MALQSSFDSVLSHDSLELHIVPVSAARAISMHSTQPERAFPPVRTTKNNRKRVEYVTLPSRRRGRPSSPPTERKDKKPKPLWGSRKRPMTTRVQSQNTRAALQNLASKTADTQPNSTRSIVQCVPTSKAKFATAIHVPRVHTVSDVQAVELEAEGKARPQTDAVSIEAHSIEPTTHEDQLKSSTHQNVPRELGDTADACGSEECRSERAWSSASTGEREKCMRAIQLREAHVHCTASLKKTASWTSSDGIVWWAKLQQQRAQAQLQGYITTLSKLRSETYRSL